MIPTETQNARSTVSKDNYTFLQTYIQRESGISIGDDKLYLLQARLVPIVESEKLRSIDELCLRLRSAPPETLRRRIVEAMTTHETLFFRDPAVFDALRKTVLPEIAKSRETTRIIRIWSAACSSGQEAYSVAMILYELGFGDWNVQIIGTDLSTQILDRATQGRYMQMEVNRGLPAAMLVKYFTKSGADWHVKDSVKKMVRFSYFDLRESMTNLGPFDLVMCRNVLIYFEMETRRKILANMRKVLFPGGYLLLGSSETTFSLDTSFNRRPIGTATFYQVPQGVLAK